MRSGSGGDGEYRGGLGQSIEIGHRDGHPFYIYAALDRIENPARGRFGGASGAAGYVGIKSGTKLKGKGKQLVPAGDRLVVHTPGGGGYGASENRSKTDRDADRRNGLID